MPRFSYEEEGGTEAELQALVKEIESILGQEFKQVYIVSPRRTSAYHKLRRAVETIRSQRVNDLLGKPVPFADEATILVADIPQDSRRTGTRDSNPQPVADPLGTREDAASTPAPTNPNGGAEPPEGSDKE